MLDIIQNLGTSDYITFISFGIACCGIAVLNHVAKKTTNTIDDKIAEALNKWKSDIKEELTKKYKK